MTAVTQDDINRIVASVKDPGVRWTNLDKGPQRDMAEMACQIFPNAFLSVKEIMRVCWKIPPAVIDRRITL